jgi:hypothetical protein
MFGHKKNMLLPAPPMGLDSHIAKWISKYKEFGKIILCNVMLKLDAEGQNRDLKPAPNTYQQRRA